MAMLLFRLRIHYQVTVRGCCHHHDDVDDDDAENDADYDDAEHTVLDISL